MRVGFVLSLMITMGLLAACGGTGSDPGLPAATSAPPTVEVPLEATNSPTTAPVATDVATALPTSTTAVPPTSTLIPVVTPTATPMLVPTASPAPTATPAVMTPSAQAARAVNVRGGPGTAYPVIGGLAAGQTVTITGKNAAGDWWQVCCVNQREGWVAASVVTASGPVGSVAVAASIPPLPPTLTSAPPAPTSPVPAATKAPPAPPASGSQYVVIEQRPLGVEENGGYLDGASVHCGYNHVAYVLVVDRNGAPVNGAIVAGQYNMDNPQVTGSKGEGRAEFVTWGSGDLLSVVRNPDGSDATSQASVPTSTNPHEIPIPWLIAGGYCQDEASCQNELGRNVCQGHFSWRIVFQKVR